MWALAVCRGRVWGGGGGGGCLFSVEQAAETSVDGSFADGGAAAAGGAGEDAVSETRERQALQPDGTMTLE